MTQGFRIHTAFEGNPGLVPMPGGSQPPNSTSRVPDDLFQLL